MIRDLARLKAERAQQSAPAQGTGSLPRRLLRRYHELRRTHSLPRVLVYFLGRFGDKIFARLRRVRARHGASSIGLPGSQEYRKLVDDVARRVLELSGGTAAQRISFALRITGGLGDALIIARMARDLQKLLGGEARFDVFFKSPAMMDFFFAGIPGFGRGIDIDLFEYLSPDYSFALITNQYATFVDKSIDYRLIGTEFPQLLAMIRGVKSQLSAIAGFVANHPYLDGTFADIAVSQGQRRYTYLHHMLGLEYGGDRLDLAVDHAVPARFGLTPKRYVTIHDGWDGQFKIASHRPTKTIPHLTWEAIVAELKRARPDLPIVQIGGATGGDVAGVDLNLKNGLEFDESAAVLAGAAVHIDSESGLVHLGAALGVRSVVMFGPTNLDWFGYPQNANIAPPRCGNCWWATDSWMDVCAIGHEIPVCTKDIDVPRVITEALRLLEQEEIRA